MNYFAIRTEEALEIFAIIDQDDGKKSGLFLEQEWHVIVRDYSALDRADPTERTSWSNGRLESPKTNWRKRRGYEHCVLLRSDPRTLLCETVGVLIKYFENNKSKF